MENCMDKAWVCGCVGVCAFVGRCLKAKMHETIIAKVALQVSWDMRVWFIRPPTDFPSEGCAQQVLILMQLLFLTLRPPEP